MASIVYSNVHQLSTSDKMSVMNIKKKSSPTPVKMLLHQQASPDSTNNNNNNNINNNNNNNMIHHTPVSTMSTPTIFTTTTVQQSAPRGRGRKSAQTYVQVIPGQPVAVARRNARERNRVKQVNTGFSTLRQHIPFSARNKKMSKVETLRCAVEYIRSLQRMLDENGGYDGGRIEDMNLDLSHNVSSSSPVSSLESGEDHSLMSMGTSDVMYETHTDAAVPTSSTLLVDDYATSEYASQLRGGVILQAATQNTSRLYSTDNNVVFDDSPLPAHPNNNTTLIRHGSSLSPGYSDRSSVNNSPATEVTTTGFMSVFTAAAAGLDKMSTNTANTGLMMDISSRNSQGLIFKKERRDEEDERCSSNVQQQQQQQQQRNGLLELEGANTAEMMEALTWWEIEQARRIQQQQQQQLQQQQQQALS